MKHVFTILAATVFLVACNSPKKKKSESNLTETVSEVPNSSPEKLNDTIPYEGSIMLLGKANRKGLQMDAFKSWFKPGYEDYEIDAQTIEKLKPLIKDVTITIFMGTWCEDSQREIPHFYKILDATEFDESNLTLITVSDEKTTSQGFEDGKNITNVPTLIFYKDGKELGRIVEYPIENLEKDMLAIISGK